MKSFLCISLIFYTLYKNSNFKYKIRNSRCSKSNKNNENSKKKMIILFYKSLLFYKLFFTPYASLLSFINIQILKTRFEIRDVQNRIKRMKIENLKRLCFFEHIRHDISYKKFHFLIKNRFLTNLFASYLMHIKNRSTHNRWIYVRVYFPIERNISNCICVYIYICDRL